MKPGKRLDIEIEHLQKTGVPRCPICKKDMENAVDSITGKISKYSWKTTCGHSPDLWLMMA